MTKTDQPLNVQQESAKKPVGTITDTERRTRRLHNENLSTPSISGMLKGNDLANISEPHPHGHKGQEIVREDSFDAEQLRAVWKDFADQVDAAQLKSALSVREPELLDNFRVEYNLDNDVQQKRIVLDLKSKLLGHLQKLLNNDLITIEFYVTENLQEIMNKPYTDQEKFNSLVAKYPALGVMKNRFGLDFE